MIFGVVSQFLHHCLCF